MTSLSIPIEAPAKLAPRAVVRNGTYPAATFTRALVDTANHVVRHRSKEVARFVVPLQSIPTGAYGERISAFGRFHSSPYAGRLWAMLTAYAPATGLTPSEVPACRIRCAPASGAVVGHGGDPEYVGDAIYYPGAEISASPAPAYIARSGPIVFVDANGAPATLPRDTDLELVFSDFWGASLVSAVVYEESLPAETASGYAGSTIAVGAPIYDGTRRDVATLLRDTYRAGCSQLLHWNALESSSVAHTTTSNVLVNVLDGASTGPPSSSSPGFRLDLAGLARVRDAGKVRITVAAYGDASVFGRGRVRAIHEAGQFIDIGPFESGYSWQAASGLVAASAGKLDFQFSTEAGSLSIAALAAYLHAP